MKRILAMVLALLLCGAALAEGFVVNTGVVWGMTLDEVLATVKPADYEIEPFGALGAQKLEIDDMRCTGGEYELKYLFFDGVLAAVGYEFDAEEFTPSAIGGALDARYGARGDGDTGLFCDLMSALTGGNYALTANLRAGDYFCDWADDEENYVVMTNRTSDDGDDIYVFIFDTLSILGGFSVAEPAPALNPDW